MNVILYLFSECESSLKLRGPTQLLLLEDKRSQGYPCVFFFHDMNQLCLF